MGEPVFRQMFCRFSCIVCCSVAWSLKSTGTAAYEKRSVSAIVLIFIVHTETWELIHYFAFVFHEDYEFERWNKLFIKYEKRCVGILQLFYSFMLC